MRASAPALERPSDEVHPTDLLALEFPALAAISSASVVGRVATGDHAGARLVRIGRDPDAAWVVSSSGPRQAHLDGFDLHANVAVPAGDPERLEHLLRYVLRPPVAQDALELTSYGQVLLKIRRPWHDGTRALVFSPVEFLASSLRWCRSHVSTCSSTTASSARRRACGARR